jgi:hypothetical protein
MKHVIILLLIASNWLNVSGQNRDNSSENIIEPIYSYAYITIQNKGFGKKLNVEVDLGDSQAQIAKGKEYSDILSNKKSYASIINYMATEKYELVITRDYNYSYQGTGGSYGLILIMRKKD